jgi:integrase
MRRAELDGDIWAIPGERTKNRRPHVVPLSPLTRDILASVESIGEHVFSTNGRTPVVIGSKIKNRLDAAMAIEPWRLHDLRRTVATGMAELGVQPHIVEAVLNHVSGAKAGVAGVYNRAAYAAEKKVALERWSAHIESSLRPAGA